MENVELKSFVKAYTKLNELVSDENLTWEQKHAKVFLDPTFVAEDLTNSGMIDVRAITLASNKSEVENLLVLCKTKLDYLRSLQITGVTV